jgi:hypothetical protein
VVGWFNHRNRQREPGSRVRDEHLRAGDRPAGLGVSAGCSGVGPPLQDTSPDGSLTAPHLRNGAEIRLPASDPGEISHEPLHVAATRSRHSSRLYEVTDATLRAALTGARAAH